MPWNETCTMDLKISLVGDWLSGNYTKSMLARKYHISRPTVDKWLNRYGESGATGLIDLSRRPHSHPNQTPDDIVQSILDMKQKFPSWGAKKINDRLHSLYPAKQWPADSTTGNILKRAGLVKQKRRRQRVADYPHYLTQPERPNHVWTVDFKGDRKLKSGVRCYPLTICDDYSRYLMECKALKSIASEPVEKCFEALFCKYGLPSVIKSDNGTPFASRAVGGLSRLSMWFISLGITPERIAKGRPTQNSRHERMHKTLQAEAMTPMGYSFSGQQKRFDAFKFEYNHLRSHEGLGRKTPSTIYTSSSTTYSGKPGILNYDLDMTVRSVKGNGEIKWKGHLVYIGSILAKEKVGLIQVDESLWEVYYGFMHIAHLNERTMRIERLKSKT